MGSGVRGARYDVTGVGESMLRFSLPPGEQLQNAHSLNLHVGGAESNVLASLAQLGRRAAWGGALPTNALGELVISRLRAAGVETRHVQRVSGARLGTYYLLNAPLKPLGTVIYDRAGSAFTTLRPEDLDLEALLDTRVLHLTGITPALGERPLALTRALLSGAAARGVAVSFDVNHRSSLWTAERASAALREMVRAATVLFCSLADAHTLFGAKGGAEAATRLLQELSQAQLVVVSDGANGVHALAGGRYLHAPSVPTAIRDRPGAGDALVAGVLDGYLSGDPERGLLQGSAMAAAALAHHGDMLLMTREELNGALAAAPSDIVR